MTQPDKLTVKELETSVFETSDENTSLLAKQLLDTMRENERLRAALKEICEERTTKNFVSMGLIHKAREALSNKDSGTAVYETEREKNMRLTKLVDSISLNPKPEVIATQNTEKK